MSERVIIFGDSHVIELFGLWKNALIHDAFLDRVLDVIDPKTIMWGSNVPHLRCASPNRPKVVDTFLGQLNPENQRDIAGFNAARLYNIKLPDAAIAAAQ